MKIYPLLIILALMAAPLSAVELGVGCEQKFELFDKTAGRPSMMFYRRDWVNALGCDRRTFYTIFLLRDRAHKFESLNVHGNWVARLYENMPIERYETLEDSAGIYRLDNTRSFRAPEFDSTFASRFAALPVQNVKTWNWECREDCYNEPVFEGLEPAMIYSDPTGLYKNFRIKEVRYYRRSDFLIILTEQPLLDLKDRTMNGLMIFSLRDWQY